MSAFLIENVFGLFKRKNFKFTSSTTLSLIYFMQRSLVNLYSLDPTVTYQHDFVFLRQLTVHLRTAIQNKKPLNQIIFDSI